MIRWKSNCSQGLSFLGPQRRHRRRRQRRLYLPPLELTDSARTRGPTHRGARPTTRSQQRTRWLPEATPKHTHSTNWNTPRPLLDYDNFCLIRNIKEELNLQSNANTSLKGLQNNCKNADFRPKSWTSSKSLQIYKVIHQGYSINFIWVWNWTFEGGRPDLFLEGL